MEDRRGRPGPNRDLQKAVRKAVQALADQWAVGEAEATTMLERLAEETERTLEEVCRSVMMGQSALRADSPRSGRKRRSGR